MEKEAKPSMGEVLPSHFDFHYDAHHGWLAVPYSAIVYLNLSLQISRNSFQNGDTVYLEEDLDAVLFIRSFLKEIGKPGDNTAFQNICSPIYDGAISIIRNFPRYNSSKRTLLEN